MKISVFLFATILFFSHYIVADETWLVTNINGYGAYSPDYVFDTDALAIKKMVVMHPVKSSRNKGDFLWY